MSYVFTVSPDFNTKFLAGWFVFNTWLQRRLGESVRLEVYDGFESQRKAIAADKIDLIYANPFDAAMLVRDKAYIALARPQSKPDEAVIAVSAESSARGVEDLLPGTRIASTDDPDVHMMGMIMLEPADLNADNVTIHRRENYVLVAKDLLKGDADAGFFLAETFDDLSPTIRDKLRVLVRSRIYVIHHLFLAHPRLAGRSADIRRLLLEMKDDEKGGAVLRDIAMQSWEAVETEDVEFMIDLMATLTT